MYCGELLLRPADLDLLHGIVDDALGPKTDEHDAHGREDARRDSLSRMADGHTEKYGSKNSQHSHLFLPVLTLWVGWTSDGFNTLLSLAYSS